ncbi:nucleotide sugar dehydrogenase [Clostridium sp. 'deep sea']|uniref:nucleotide sugar dehydrogenase n=1 Tax=Clostridium sp. 'deep sea' TaxID=2779445 RepID=UPI0018965B7E|nr:nucleotide sugar dehydrogenase [Clostridium sp. 'deep sea']QOR35722.1 nucleotide sugar dehydrogenase [Clostridium sp. 'deep sea']
MKTKNNNKVITVVGLGYVGLPLLVLIASKGFNVIGYDISKKRIEDIHNRNSFSFDYDKKSLEKYIEQGSLRLTDSSECLAISDVIIVCVPTMIDDNKNPVTTHLLSATTAIRNKLTKNTTIIYESSTYPGCTRDLVSLLEQSGLSAGIDFFVGFSPERIDPSNKKYFLKNIPKVVSGLTTNCVISISELYINIFDNIHPVSSLETAEFTKLFENTFRYINIAYVNEMALAAEKLGLNIWEIINAAATKPFGYLAFYPGPGVGGSCIPVNPWYMQHTLRKINQESSLINVSKSVNENMPKHIVNLVINNKLISRDELRVLILGVSYKKNVADSRLSPSLDIASSLHKQNIEFKLFDPYIREVNINNKQMQVYQSDLKNWIDWSNIIIILTNHDNFNYSYLLKSEKAIIDARGVLESYNNHFISTLGKGELK